MRVRASRKSDELKFWICTPSRVFGSERSVPPMTQFFGDASDAVLLVT